jgi:DNA-3-methyladenine glycosylase
MCIDWHNVLKLIGFKKIMAVKLTKDFFKRDSKIVAKKLIGKVLVRKLNSLELRAKILETEAYFDEKDPSSWARFGKRKDNFLMWEEGGKILVKNVHKYFMLNFVTGQKGKAEAVLIRKLKPLNFEDRCGGPGLLTNSLKIDKNFNGMEIGEDIWVEQGEKLKIGKGFRIGVKEDLEVPLRFFTNE